MFCDSSHVLDTLYPVYSPMAMGEVKSATAPTVVQDEHPPGSDSRQDMTCAS